MDTYEKKYKDALERAQKELQTCGSADCDAAKQIFRFFPELKESEDERILEIIKHCIESRYLHTSTIKGISQKECFAWLEKQAASIDVDSILNKVGIQPAYKDGNAWCILYGDNIQDGTCGFGDTKEDALVEFIKELLENQGEQNHADKVKPKFKVGDWITNGEAVFHITNYDIEYGYQLKTTKGTLFHFSDEVAEKKYHLLTIQDAKQKYFDYENANIQQKDFAPQKDIPRYSIGDVLCDKSCTTLNNESQSNFEITDIRNGMYICDKCSFTISQQDEYELVAKRVEQKPADLEEFISELSKQFPDVSFAKLSRIAVRVAKWAKPTDEEMKELLRTEYEKGRADTIAEMQKPAWSEEDEMIALSIEQVMNCASLLNIVPEKIDKIRTWLKSLKQRIQHL